MGIQLPPSRKKRLTSTFQLRSTLPYFILFLFADSLPFSPHDSIFLLSVSTASPSLSSFSPQFLPLVLFLYKNKIKEQRVTLPRARRLLCSAAKVRRQVDLCLPPSLVLPLTLTLFHSHHTKANPLFLLLLLLLLSLA